MPYHAHNIAVVCVLTVSLLFFGACTGSEESAAEAFCDKLIECGEIEAEYREACVFEIQGFFAATEVEDGEECRSATVDAVECASELTCGEFQSGDRCQEEEDRADIVC